MADFVFPPSIEDSWHKPSSGELVFAAHLDRIGHLVGRHFCQDSLEWGAQYTLVPIGGSHPNLRDVK